MRVGIPSFGKKKNYWKALRVEVRLRYSAMVVGAGLTKAFLEIFSSCKFEKIPGREGVRKRSLEMINDEEVTYFFWKVLEARIRETKVGDILGSRDVQRFGEGCK